jgi:hypothetical protein
MHYLNSSSEPRGILRVILSCLIPLLALNQQVGAQSTCDAILRNGVFNLTTIDSRKTVQDNLYEWLKTTEWEQFKGAQNSGLKIAFPIDGVPVEFSGSHSEDKFREWKRAVDQGRIRNFSSEEFLQIVQRSASTEIVNAWLECIKATAGVGLSCSATANGELGIILSFKFSPNSITDYPPTVLPYGFQVVGAKAPAGFGPGSEIPIGGASIILTRDTPTSSVTIVINSEKGSCQRFLEGGKPGEPKNDLPPLVLRTFQSTSTRAGMPEASVTVPPEYKLIGGGCRANWTTHGNHLTACYPSGIRTWTGRSKDHIAGDPSTLDVFAVAVADPNDEWLTYTQSSTSNPTGWPVATAVLPAGYVLTGGGAEDHWRGNGNMLTASYPDGSTAWTAKGKDALHPDPSSITSYAIGIRPRNGADMPAVSIFRQTSSVAQHPSANVSVPDGYQLLSGGAFADWRTHGSHLTSSFPSSMVEWSVASKDIVYPEATSITAYAIGVKFLPKACEYQIGPDRFTFGPSGGTATVTVSTTNGCAVPVSSGDYWVQVNPKGQLTGSQTITLTIPANASPSPRTGAVSVAGRSLAIQQDSAPVCTGMSARLGRIRFDATGGSAIVEVVAPTGCPWTAVTTSDFVTVRPSGQGSMNLDLVVSPNRTAASRTATLTVAGTTLQLTQDGVATVCADFVVRLASDTFNAAGGTGTVEIEGQAGCSWTAKSSESFVTFPQTAGQGSAKAAFTVGIHSGTTDRTALLTVAGKILQLTQRAGGNPPVVQDPDASILAGGQFSVKWLYGQAASGRWFIVKPPAATSIPGVGGANSVLLLKGIDIAANDIAWKPAHAFAQSVGQYPPAGVVYESVTVSADNRSVEFGRLISQNTDIEVTELASNRYQVRWFYFSADQDRKWYIGNAEQASANSPAILMLKAVDPKTEGQILWKPIHNFPAFGSFPAAGQRFDAVQVASDGKLILFGSLK